MPRPENAGKGRESAPGQNSERTFVNDTGQTVTGTMQDFHQTLREQGYRQVDDIDEGEVVVTDPTEPTPA